MDKEANFSTDITIKLLLKNLQNRMSLAEPAINKRYFLFKIFCILLIDLLTHFLIQFLYSFFHLVSSIQKVLHACQSLKIQILPNCCFLKYWSVLKIYEITSIIIDKKTQRGCQQIYIHKVQIKLEGHLFHINLTQEVFLIL
ncbi:unnamed protein product [Paramecium octaurelia]|uniref:Transmembrane protein n=1 Tax=Paramecium octaurelia TaxID=43137 RepID=A0A8S1YL82_PAROT|nr:unnamed protein product [Paramecium octaurelia]